ncbi:MAG: cupredoxin family protein [Usitatibacter sp.]
MKIRILTTLAAVAVCTAAAQAFAHGDEKAAGAKKKSPISTEQHAWGREGDPRKVSRTISIDMADTMRFSPSELKVKRGETVKFLVRNTGKVTHEMVLGTEEDLKAHAELMKKHPGMEHEAPYMAHVAPGRKEEITWTFDKPGTFMYGCLIPGHWEAGMKGAVVVAN